MIANRTDRCATRCLLVAALALAACAPADYNPTPKTDTGIIPPNTCPEGQLQCTGDPDDGTLVCRCSGVFECPTPEKCETASPVPPGGGTWSCSWQEFKYTCTSTDVLTPPGSGSWSCFKNEQGGVTCVSTSLAPDGSGTWTCTVVGDTLECTKKPDGEGNWKCTADKKQCTEGSESLPPGGGNWKCHQTLKDGKPTWVCVGDSTSVPGGGGWTCVKLSEPITYRCEKEVEAPPGGGNYQCMMGSEFGGTKCEEVPTKPIGSTCLVGEVKWCDGLDYCGWGQVACDPKTGKWKTKLVNGKVVEDCYELGDGARPNTVCACYHFYFNAACCERPDCVVPSGTKPQVCPPSAGGLCDYCNPEKPECKATGAKCIISNAHETFCGVPCSANVPCPAGYQCQVVKPFGGQPTNQCVPVDHSCYF